MPFDEIHSPLAGSGVHTSSFYLADGAPYASVVIGQDAIDLRPSQVHTRSTMPCLGSSSKDATILLKHVLGASRMGDAAVHIWYVSSKTDSSGQSHRTSCSLRKTPALQCQSPQGAEKLVAAVRAAACASAGSKPHRVTAFINPISGKGRAMDVFSKVLRPILEDAAGMEVTAVQLQRPEHATELAAQLDLSSTDMLMCLGGDGTLWEALQGLLSRPDWQRCCQLPVMQVPLGSGNGVATSCGIMDPVAAAYAAVKGRTSAMDVASVLQGDRRFYMVLLFTYGLMSNLDVDTGHLRWMGEARLTYGAIKEILKGSAYGCRVAYLPADAAQEGADGGGAQASQASEAPAPTTIPLPILTTLGGTPPAVPPTTDALPAGWQLLEVPHVQLFGMFNLPWIAQTYHFNPAGSLNSGHFNMIYTSRQLSKPEGIKLLLASEEGKHLGLDGVEMSTFKALMFEPLESGTSVMLDGEVVPFQPLYVEVHPGLCTVVVAPEWQP